MSSELALSPITKSAIAMDFFDISERSVRLVVLIIDSFPSIGAKSPNVRVLLSSVASAAST